MSDILAFITSNWPHINLDKRPRSPIALHEALGRIAENHTSTLYMRRLTGLTGWSFHPEAFDAPPTAVLFQRGDDCPLYIQWESVSRHTTRHGRQSAHSRLLDIRHVKTQEFDNLIELDTSPPDANQSFTLDGIHLDCQHGWHIITPQVMVRPTRDSSGRLVREPQNPTSMVLDILATPTNDIWRHVRGIACRKRLTGDEPILSLEELKRISEGVGPSEAYHKDCKGLSWAPKHNHRLYIKARNILTLTPSQEEETPILCPVGAYAVTTTEKLAVSWVTAVPASEVTYSQKISRIRVRSGLSNTDLVPVNTGEQIIWNHVMNGTSYSRVR